MFKGLHVIFLLGDLCDCARVEESSKKILHSHICDFCIYITRNNIAVCGTVGVEVWKAEAKDSSNF